LGVRRRVRHAQRATLALAGQQPPRRVPLASTQLQEQELAPTVRLGLNARRRLTLRLPAPAQVQTSTLLPWPQLAFSVKLDTLVLSHQRRLAPLEHTLSQDKKSAPNAPLEATVQTQSICLSLVPQQTLLNTQQQAQLLAFCVLQAKRVPQHLELPQIVELALTQSSEVESACLVRPGILAQTQLQPPWPVILAPTLIQTLQDPAFSALLDTNAQL
jgi:hypothetical protein